MKIKILSSIICLCVLMICTLNVNAITTSGEYDYEVNDYGDTATLLWYYNSEPDTHCDIVIPEFIDGYRIVAIGEGAFANDTSINSITIPVSVTYIAGYAFVGCTNLSTVYYAGTQEQWDAITIEEGNDALSSAAIIPPCTGPILGDLDGDGYISACDSLLMRKFLGKIITADDIDLAAADVNEDGAINAKDQYCLRVMLAK